MHTDAQRIEVSEIRGFEQITAIIAGRPLFHFSVVHSFCYFDSGADNLNDSQRDIELVMEELEAPRAQVGIRFHCVADVSFSGFGQIMGLHFQSIQERGWERLRFEVGDYEDAQIHLFCHDISLFDPKGVVSPCAASNGGS